MRKPSSPPSIHSTTADLLAFIEASPTPYHCVAEVERRAAAAGFLRVEEGDAWDLEPGRGYMVARSGAIVLFRVGMGAAADAGFRLVGAHTDSPNLRVKPNADFTKDGYRQLGVEVYGGVLTHTWLDRDLGLAGKVVLRGDEPGGLERRLVTMARPMARVASLAIHLDREVTKKGLILNNQLHLPPVLALTDDSLPKNLRAVLAAELEVEEERILSWDLSLMDVQPPAVGGLRGEFIFSPRLDNQASCHAALTALLRAPAAQSTQIACLYDHEEVGSGSTSGAGGSLVEDVLTRIAAGGAEALHRASARSWQISADMAHALHPNFTDKHEPHHQPRLNGGPVIKVNAQQRYATDAEGEAFFELLCRDANVPFQKFVSRTDLACGSTIGPISSARLGIRTIDVGNPMLSMHSIREQGGAEDPERMAAVLARFFEA
ncbi:M18 family aminopeptidase [Vulgatibacter incomptus]|uniref:M18 family aminopeptidase n=1 Tax=Vulgatibacter incomptus TaxID=1391653 RepID=A0A0K1PG56_9BACT|nr:M18 family aminopeptidase [Vulgatibacter incomptus]AKU92500.1 Aspartyl aminopeptidase [Vulgatibacter incomptus]